MRFASSFHSASSRRSIGTILCEVFFVVAVIPFYSCGLRAQEGEVIGDRAELQKVLDAYDQLKTTLESYDATVECKHDRTDGAVVLGKYEISKRGSLYSLSKTIDCAKEMTHFEVEDYLDMGVGYLENVDRRVGIIKTLRRQKSDADYYAWTPLTLPLTSPIDLDCFCIMPGRSIRPLMDPANMKGIPRQVHVEKRADGNVVLTRKYQSGTVLEMIASAEFGYLLTSYRYAVHTKPGQAVDQADFTWSKLPNGKLVPKSKKYTNQLPNNTTDSRSWEVTSLTIPSTKTEIKKLSLDPPIGWKIVDLEAKTEQVIGGEEGKRVRALLDSANRVRVGFPQSPY